MGIFFLPEGNSLAAHEPIACLAFLRFSAIAAFATSLLCRRIFASVSSFTCPFTHA